MTRKVLQDQVLPSCYLFAVLLKSIATDPQVLPLCQCLVHIDTRPRLLSAQSYLDLATDIDFFSFFFFFLWTTLSSHLLTINNHYPKMRETAVLQALGRPDFLLESRHVSYGKKRHPSKQLWKREMNILGFGYYIIFMWKPISSYDLG